MPRSEAAVDTGSPMTFDPQISAVAAALVAGYLMTVAGVQKRALRWRRPPRRCPACRHEQRDCTCRATGRRRGLHFRGLH
jgi:hypothetical protein